MGQTPPRVLPRNPACGRPPAAVAVPPPPKRVPCLCLRTPARARLRLQSRARAPHPRAFRRPPTASRHPLRHSAVAGRAEVSTPPLARPPGSSHLYAAPVARPYARRARVSPPPSMSASRTPLPFHRCPSLLPYAAPQTNVKTGLTSAMVAQRLEEYGLNMLPEKHVSFAARCRGRGRGKDICRSCGRLVWWCAVSVSGVKHGTHGCIAQRGAYTCQCEVVSVRVRVESSARSRV